MKRLLLSILFLFSFFRVQSAEVTDSWSLAAGEANVLDWGARRDGKTDDAPAINAAIAWALRRPGTEVVIPPGRYAVGSTIYVRGGNIAIRCLGWLRNIDGTNTTVLAISPTYNDHNGTIRDGLGIPEAGNVSIDGGGVGIIDQNSQHATEWDFEKPEVTGAFHAFYASDLAGLNIRNLTVTNGIMWGLAVELCQNVSITSCRVYNGFCNNRRVAGVRKYLGGQDGIHATDCREVRIIGNYSEAGDDAIVVSSLRAFAANSLIANNTCWTKVFATEADGVTLNPNSNSGRFALAIYCQAVRGNAGLTNVVVSGNVVPGGAGLFGIYDTGVAHVGTVDGVRFTGNAWSGLNSPGNPAVKPFPIDAGWIIQGGKNIELAGNSFADITRWGRILSNEGSAAGRVVWRGNRFSRFGIPNLAMFPDQTPSVLWLSGGATEMVVEDNLFEDCAIVPIEVGASGDIRPDQFALVAVNRNRFVQTNSRFRTGSPDEEAGCLVSYGATAVEFIGNSVRTNYGPAVIARAFRSAKIRDNDINGLGTSEFESSGDAFRLMIEAAQSATETIITGNVATDLAGRFLDAQNVGRLLLANNTVRNACRSHGNAMVVAMVIRGPSLDSPPFVNFSGRFTGNWFSAPTAQNPLYLDATVSTANYTGARLRYADTDAQGNYRPAITQAAAGLVEFSSRTRSDLNP